MKNAAIFIGGISGGLLLAYFVIWVIAASSNRS